jgi:hypothetical protein
MRTAVVYLAIYFYSNTNYSLCFECLFALCLDNGNGYASRALGVSVEGWVGHPMDPVGCLFSTLLDAANNASSKDRAGVVLRLLAVTFIICMITFL